MGSFDAEKVQRTLMLLDTLTSSGNLAFKVAAKRSCLELCEGLKTDPRGVQGDSAPVIQAYAGKVTKKIQYVVGEKVEIYSMSLGGWQEGMVVEVTSTSVTALYGDRKKDMDLADPALADSIRPEKDPYADIPEDEPEPELEEEEEGGLALEVDKTGDDDEDEEEDEYDEGGDIFMELDETIKSPTGVGLRGSMKVEAGESVASVTRRMSVQHSVTPEEMAIMLGTSLDDETTVEQASKKGKFAKGVKSRGGGLKEKAAAKKAAASAKAKEKGANAKAKAQAKALNAKQRAKGELTAGDEVQLLISFYASVGTKRQLDVDDVEAMIEGEGFESLVARLEQQYHINPIEAWRNKDADGGADDDMPEMDRTAEFDAHYGIAKPYIEKITAAVEAKEKGDALRERQPGAAEVPGPEQADCVAATQSLMKALSIKPDSAEVVEGLEVVAAADLKILSSVLMTVMMMHEEMETTKEKDNVFPFVRSIARRNVDKGRELIETDGRAALKSLQLAVQLDPKNPDAESLFGDAEDAILAEQAEAEEEAKKQKIAGAQKEVDDLMEKRQEFLDEIEGDKMALKYLAKNKGEEVPDDDDELTDEQQDMLDAIDDTVADAEVVVMQMKKAAMTSKRSWISVQGGRMENKEGKLADRMSWKKRFAVLEDGVFSYYPNEALSEEVKEELFVKPRKQEEVILEMNEGQEARWKIIVEEFDVGFQAFFSSESEDMEYEELIVKARKVEALTLEMAAGQRARWNLMIHAFDVMAKVTFTNASGTEMVVMDQETVGNPNNPRQGGKYAGSYDAGSDGTLTLYVDNSYSKMRGKHVKYFMYEMDPEEAETEAMNGDVSDPIPEDVPPGDADEEAVAEEAQAEPKAADGEEASAAAEDSEEAGTAAEDDEEAEPSTPTGSDASGARDSIRNSLAMNEQHADDEVLAPYRIIGNPKNAKEGGTTSGSFVAPRDGNLILVFDNSYSKARKKRLLYTLEEENPDDSEEEGSIDINIGDDGEELANLDLSLCTDPPFCEEETWRIGIEMPERTYMFECNDEDDFADWLRNLAKTLALLHGQEWLDKADEEEGDEKVGEGTLHISWQLIFRELLPNDATPDMWVNMGAAGSEEGAPTEPTWSLVGNGDNLYKIVCRELLELEEMNFKGDSAVVNGQAVDWLCEELCLRVGIGDKRRTLIELGVALNSFKLTVPCLGRVGRALKRSKVFESELAGPERELYDSICTYVREAILNMFKVYKVSFPEDQKESENLLKAALDCLEAVSENWDDLIEALNNWPMKLLGTLVGEDLVGLEDWSAVPFTAKTLNQFCEIASPDLTLDDEYYRFLIPEAVAAKVELSSMVDILCRGYVEALEKALSVVMHHVAAEHYSKGFLLYLYQAARDVFAVVEDISPMLAENLSKKISGVTKVFGPVLDAHIERVSTQQEKWLETSIRQDNSATVLLDDGTREVKEPWQKLKPCSCREECHCSPVLHSVSVDDIYRMLFQVSRPLMQYWTPKYIAKVVRDAVVAYCERLCDQLMMEITSGESDDGNMLGNIALGIGGMGVGAAGDVANLGFGALTAISKGAGGVFTETYKGAKKGGAVGLAKGLTKGTLNAAVTTVGTGIATARAATDLAEGLAMQAIDTATALTDEALKQAESALDGGLKHVNEFGMLVGALSEEEEEEPEEEDQKMFPDSFWVKMNNIHRASQQLDELGMDATPLFGEMTDEDIDEVEEQILAASSSCRKILNSVVKALMDRNKQILMGHIAMQIAPVAVWAKTNEDPEAEGRPEVSWNDAMDFCDLALGEPHEHLYNEVFEKMLRELCVAWTQAVEGILGATAESLPPLVIDEMSDAVDFVNQEFWEQSVQGQFNERFLGRATGEGSRVRDVIALHKKPTADLGQIVVDVNEEETGIDLDGDGVVSGQVSDIEHWLAIGVLARRPDYMKVAQAQVDHSNGKIKLSLFLAPPTQVNIKMLPAKMLEETAEIQGWVDKEITTGGMTGNFRKRWLVLWRHPDDAQGNYSLIWYEKEDSMKPKGLVMLAPGLVTVTHPKNKRKGHENAFRMDVVLPDDMDGDDGKSTHMHAHTKLADQTLAGHSRPVFSNCRSAPWSDDAC